MKIQEWLDQLEESCDSKTEYCYSLLALHVKNCEKISKAIEEHGTAALNEAVNRPYAIDEHVLSELIEEMGKLVNESKGN